MVTSIVSSSSLSSAAYILKNNAKSSTEAVAQVSSASKSATGQNPLQTDSLSLRSKNSSAMNSNVISNVGNALSFLNAQASSLNRVATIVSQMSEITSKMTDVTMTASDTVGYTQQINGLRAQLATEMFATYGDQRLHKTKGVSDTYSVSLDPSGTQTVSFTQSDFVNNTAGLGWYSLAGLRESEKDVPQVPNDTPSFNSSGSPTNGDGSLGNLGSFTGSEGNQASQVTSPSQPPSSPSQISRDSTSMSSDVGTKEDPLLSASWSPSDFESLTNAVSAMLATNAAQQESLQNGLDVLKSRDTGLATAAGQISDSDVAHQVASLAKFQLINQSASSAMTQTNLSAQGVIKALWGEPSSGIEWYKPEQLTSILPKIAFA